MCVTFHIHFFSQVLYFLHSCSDTLHYSELWFIFFSACISATTEQVVILFWCIFTVSRGWTLMVLLSSSNTTFYLYTKSIKITRLSRIHEHIRTLQRTNLLHFGGSFFYAPPSGKLWHNTNTLPWTLLNTFIPPWGYLICETCWMYLLNHSLNRKNPFIHHVLFDLFPSLYIILLYFGYFIIFHSLYFYLLDF